MAFFLVELPSNAGGPGFDGINACVVSAASAADARAACKALRGGDQAAAWDAATTTQLADVAANAVGALVGWRFRVQLLDLSPVGVAADVTVVGDATNDTLDEVGTALAAALNALPNIAAAGYDTLTQILTIAGVADNLGDHKAIVEVSPPAVLNSSGREVTEPAAIPGFVTAIVHQGAVGAAVTATFAADTFVIAKVLAQYRLGV